MSAAPTFLHAQPALNPQQQLAAAYLTWQDATGQVDSLIFDLVISEDWDIDAAVTEHPVEKGANVTDNVRPKLQVCRLHVLCTEEPIDSNNWDDITINVDTADIAADSWKKNDGRIMYKEWDSRLTERLLLSTGAGLVGGLLGSTASAIGAVAGGVIGSALLEGREKDVTIQTQVSQDPKPKQSITVTGSLFAGGEAQDYVAATIGQLKSLRDSATIVSVVGTKGESVQMVIEKLSWHREAGTGTGAELQLQLKELRVVSTTTVPAPAPSVPRASQPVSKGSQEGSEPPVKSSATYRALYGDSNSAPPPGIAAP